MFYIWLSSFNDILDYEQFIFFSYSPSRAERKKQAARKPPCHQLSRGLFFSLHFSTNYKKKKGLFVV